MPRANLLLIGFLLLLFGIMAVYSVSVQESFSLTLIQGDPSNYFYFFRQLRNIAVALVMGIIVYKMPLERFKKNYKWIFLGMIVFQLLVLTPIGIDLNGSRSWLYLPGLGTLQPSEFFKIGFGIFIAGWLNEKKNVLNDRVGILGYIIIVGISVLLFLIIKDNGTILVMGILSLVMYWYAGGSGKMVGVFVLLGSLFGVLIVSQFDYVQKRVGYFLNPDPAATEGVGWQIIQSLNSVGGGGILGRGYGKGIQKFIIPEAQSDFIFAAFSEEVGFAGNIFLIFLFWRLMYSYLGSIRNLKDNYYRLLGGSMISLIIIQTFINIGVNINILPLTGLTLPFVSFGGSAIMANMVELMMLHKIIKTANRSASS